MVCVKKRVNFKNSHLYCSWKLTVIPSPSHNKNYCHHRSCLQKTEILFSQSNISPAEMTEFFWQILFQKASHLLLEPHSNFATHLYCCFSSWPMIKGICASVILQLSNKERKHNLENTCIYLFSEHGMWQLMILVDIKCFRVS